MFEVIQNKIETAVTAKYILYGKVFEVKIMWTFAIFVLPAEPI